MNDKRRTELKKAVSLLNDVMYIVNDNIYEEEEAMENTHENLRNTDRYVAMAEILDRLEDAITDLETAKEYITAAINKRE